MERPAGPVRLRVVLARRRPPGHRPAVRRGQRARPALPPGDHRAGDRHPRRDVPGPVLGRAGHRRGEQRAHHRRRLAAQGRARRPAAGVRRRHPGAARRRGGQPRRPGPGRPGPALDPPAAAAGPDRRGGQRRHRPLVRRVGGRPDHRQRAHRTPAADDRRLPGGRRTRPAAPAGARQLGARAGRGRGDRVRPVAQQRLRPADLLGPGHRRALRRGLRAGADGEGRRGRQHLGDTGRHVGWLEEYVELGFDQIALHHVGQEQRAFIDTFGAQVLPKLRTTA